VVQEAEEGRRQGLRKRGVSRRSLISGGSERRDAAADEDRQEPVIACRAGHVDNRAQLREIGVAVEMNNRRQGLESCGLNLCQVLAFHFEKFHEFFQKTWKF
jgi:hypothetical protein